MTKSVLLTPLALAIGLGATYIPLRSQSATVQTAPPNAPHLKPAFEGQTRVAERKADVAFDVVTISEGLQNPWGFSFLPGGRVIVTEKAGRMRIVAADGTLSEPITGLPPVDARGQGGLLDVALDPQFPANQFIYWSYSEPQGDGTNNTAVARGKLVTDSAPRLDNVQVIFHQAPSLNSQQHFGSRLVFGRDGTLFVTLGERSILPGRVQAQDLGGLIGKIVRINSDGTIPKDNPFVGKDGVRPEIWSYGHRNVQGATLHPTTGELWSIEHGPRGGDELNIPRKGKDYGWPTITYGIEYNGQPIGASLTAREGMEQPVYYWDPVIAPGGITFYTGALFPAWQGSLFIGAMGGKHLVRLTLSGDRVVGEERLLTDLQPQTERIRDVGQGPDGALYFITDNAKGRLMKIVPKK